MKPIALLHLLLLCASLPAVQAQLLQNIPVLHGTDTLQAAWAGGLNNPQLSSTDWDGDGLQDLFVFDRADASMSAWVQRWPAGQLRWVFAPGYAATVPPRPNAQWAFLQDYDADGLQDLVCDTNSNVQVWRRRSSHYQLLYPRVPAVFAGFTTVAYSAASGLPGLADVDADGDLDLLAFDVNGLRVDYYKNVGVEQLGRTDTLLWQVASQCWGHFTKTGGPLTGDWSITLGLTNCGITEFKTDHEGGTLLPIHLNGDATYDLLVTEADFGNLAALTNTGTSSIANMGSFVLNYPPAAPINLRSSPAAFWVDVDGDGARDLALAPNQVAGLQDQNGVQWMKNTGSNTAASFTTPANPLLQQDMIDLGTGAYPAFADVDGDGRTDLLVGCASRYAGVGQRGSQLVFYKNIGLDTLPAFQLHTSDWLGLASLPDLAGAFDFYPAFGDVDADGDADLLLGYSRASVAAGLLFFRSLTAQGQPGSYLLQQNNFLGITAENLNRTAPHLSDIDQDGDLDLIVGHQQGTLHYYENVGNAVVGNWVLRARGWGGVNVSDLTFSSLGNSRPLVADIDNDNQPELLVGAANGQVVVYDNLAQNTFTRVGAWQGMRFGRQAAPAAAKLRANDTLSIVVGGLRGGLHLLQQPGRLFTDVGGGGAATNDDGVVLYPNPANTLVLLRAPAGTVVTVYSSAGERLATLHIAAADVPAVLDVTSWPQALYLAVYDTPMGRRVRKFVVGTP